MIVLGLVLLVVGFLLHISILTTLGIILLAGWSAAVGTGTRSHTTAAAAPGAGARSPCSQHCRRPLPRSLTRADRTRPVGAFVRPLRPVIRRRAQAPSGRADPAP